MRKGIEDRDRRRDDAEVRAEARAERTAQQQMAVPALSPSACGIFGV